MSLAEVGLVVTPVIAIVTVAAAIIRDRRKPRLDDASSEQMRAQAKKLRDETNARRDTWVLQLENWAFDKARPWMRDAVVKFDRQSDQVDALAGELGRTVDRITLNPAPDMPTPPLPD